MRNNKREPLAIEDHRFSCGCTQHLKNIASMRKMEKGFRNIFNALPHAIFVTDLNGKIVECNYAALEMCGVSSKSELVEKSFFDFIAEKDRYKIIEKFEKALPQVLVRNLECSFEKNGAESSVELSANIWKNALGKPLGFVAILKEASSCKKAEEALVESEKRYRSVVDNIGIGVAVISPKMEILALNKQMKKWFPYIDVSEKPTCYKAYNRPPRKEICSYCPTYKTFIDGKVHESITETPQNGKIINYRVVASPIKNDKGEVTAAVEMVEDITERKNMEEKLKQYSKKLEKLVEERTSKLWEQEEQFRSVADHASEAIITIDKKARIIFWNKAAQKIFGYSASEAIGKSIKIILPRKTRKTHYRKLLQKISNKKAYSSGKTFEVVGLRKNKTEFPMEVSFSVWKTKKGTFSTSIIRDITERKKAQLALRESEKRYRKFIEAAPETIYTVDRNGILTSLNPVFEKISGWKRKDWIGKPFAKLVHPDDLPLAVKTFKQILRGKTPPPYELRILSKSGEYLVGEFTSKPNIENGKIIGEFGIARNVTERKKTEQALKASETKYRSLFENVPVGVFQTSPEGKVLTANPALVRLFGYASLSEFLAIDIPRDLYVNPEDRKVWQRELEEKNELNNVELLLKRKDGQKVIVLENVRTVRNEKGDVLYYEGTLTDITEIKRLEERLSALNIYSGKLNKSRSLQKIYDLSLEAVEKTVDFDSAAFFILEKDKLQRVCSRGRLRLLKSSLNEQNKSLAMKAINARRCILSRNLKNGTAYTKTKPKVKSEIAVPIRIEGKVIGVLYAQKTKESFREKDAMLLQILSSHVATAINNLEQRREIEKRSRQMAVLMKSSAEMIRSTDLHYRLRKIAESVRAHGWRRVVIRAVDEKTLEPASPKDLVTAGLTKKERDFLWKNGVPGQVWRERFGPEYARFKIGEFYYLPWSDPWVRKRFSQGIVTSHLKPEDMIDWNPDDLLYAPLRLADGRIVGMLSIDDPADGRKPTKESLAPLELFLHQAAVAIENAQLFKQLNEAKNKIKEYADQLEMRVKQRTRELEEAQQKLLKAERLATIGETAAMVGHDIRNPLTGIAGAAYYLKTKLNLTKDKKVKEMLEVIERDVEYSNKIVNDLLDYSRDISLELKESTLKNIVTEALALVKVPSNIRVVNLVNNNLRLCIDPEKMKRTFANLIRNAVDAMPKGGTLTIKSKKAKNHVKISFSDTGVGIENEVLKKLWSPLCTTKAKGMGFGLAICKRLVEAHDGTISAESTVGKGTTFTITLPMKPKVKGGENVWVNVPESLLSTMMKL
ncbi:MAG: PAS domain S-box protein [Candidatus Bathyarchaeia archaeon]